jgi:hypothetical protein
MINFQSGLDLRNGPVGLAVPASRGVGIFGSHHITVLFSPLFSLHSPHEHGMNPFANRPVI